MEKQKSLMERIREHAQNEVAYEKGLRKLVFSPIKNSDTKVMEFIPNFEILDPRLEVFNPKTGSYRKLGYIDKVGVIPSLLGTSKELRRMSDYTIFAGDIRDKDTIKFYQFGPNNPEKVGCNKPISVNPEDDLEKYYKCIIEVYEKQNDENEEEFLEQKSNITYFFEDEDNINGLLNNFKNKYDAVYAIGSFQEMHNKEQGIELLRDFLKSSGKIIIYDKFLDEFEYGKIENYHHEWEENVFETFKKEFKSKERGPLRELFHEYSEIAERQGRTPNDPSPHYAWDFSGSVEHNDFISISIAEKYLSQAGFKNIEIKPFKGKFGKDFYYFIQAEK